MNNSQVGKEPTLNTDEMVDISNNMNPIGIFDTQALIWNMKV